MSLKTFLFTGKAVLSKSKATNDENLAQSEIHIAAPSYAQALIKLEHYIKIGETLGYYRR